MSLPLTTVTYRHDAEPNTADSTCVSQSRPLSSFHTPHSRTMYRRAPEKEPGAHREAWCHPVGPHEPRTVGDPDWWTLVPLKWLRRPWPGWSLGGHPPRGANGRILFGMSDELRPDIAG